MGPYAKEELLACVIARLLVGSRHAAIGASSPIPATGAFLHRHADLRAEPSGAVGVAALLAGRVRPAGPAVAVVSGGNVDPDLYRRLVAE